MANAADANDPHSTIFDLLRGYYDEFLCDMTWENFSLILDYLRNAGYGDQNTVAIIAEHFSSLSQRGAQIQGLLLGLFALFRLVGLKDSSTLPTFMQHLVGQFRELAEGHPQAVLHNGSTDQLYNLTMGMYLWYTTSTHLPPTYPFELYGLFNAYRHEVDEEVLEMYRNFVQTHDVFPSHGAEQEVEEVFLQTVRESLTRRFGNIPQPSLLLQVRANITHWYDTNHVHGGGGAAPAGNTSSNGSATVPQTILGQTRVPAYPMPSAGDHDAARHAAFTHADGEHQDTMAARGASGGPADGNPVEEDLGDDGL